MKDYFGFEYQNGGTCGVHSFMHAMNLVGIPTELDEAKKLVKYIDGMDWSKWEFDLPGILNAWQRGNGLNDKIYKIAETIAKNWGTEGNGILSGIKKKNCIPLPFECGNSKEARIIIDRLLEQGIPVIMAVNWNYDAGDDGHWVVCAGKKNNKYIIVDSAPSGRKGLFGIYSWIELKDRFIWFEDDETDYFLCQMIGVKPKDNISIVPRIPKILDKLKRNRYWRQWWGYYLADLRDIARDFKSKDSVSLGALLNSQSESIINSMYYWLDDCDKNSVRREVLSYIYVAKVYDLKVARSKTKEILINFVLALAGNLIYDQ